MPATPRPIEHLCPTCKCSASDACWDLIRNDAYPDGIFHKARIEEARAKAAQAEDNANRPPMERPAYRGAPVDEDGWGLAPRERFSNADGF